MTWPKSSDIHAGKETFTEIYSRVIFQDIRQLLKIKMDATTKRAKLNFQND